MADERPERKPEDLAKRFDDWAFGQPESWDQAPTLTYQVLAGRVYTSKRWPTGSVVRGETTLDALEALIGGPVTKEGFYNALGEYLGSTYRDEDAWKRGEDPVME